MVKNPIVTMTDRRIEERLNQEELFGFFDSTFSFSFSFVFFVPLSLSFPLMDFDESVSAMGCLWFQKNTKKKDDRNQKRNSAKFGGVKMTSKKGRQKKSFLVSVTKESNFSSFFSFFFLDAQTKNFFVKRKLEK